MSRADLSPTKPEPDGTLQGCVCETSVLPDDIIVDQTIVNVEGAEKFLSTLASYEIDHERAATPNGDMILSARVSLTGKSFKFIK